MSSGVANETPDAGAIDAVITWVDGSDPVHAAKRNAALAQPGRFSFSAIPGGRNETRFASSGEIEYCILGIRKHCPWIRKIFVVTDGQVPAFLAGSAADRLGVCIVDHRHLFRGHEWALPTFNSRAIETTIHRIDGLAERFVYFNDDMIVVGGTSSEDFFAADGRVVLRGSWQPLPSFGTIRVVLSSIVNHFSEKVLGKVRSMAVGAQYRAAHLAGFKGRFLKAPHTPYPLRKATLSAYFQQNPDVFEHNIGYRFRDMAQFVPIPLANHLEIRAGNHVEPKDDEHILVCFNRDSLQAIRRKIELLEAGRHRFLCLQGLENARPQERDRILAFLDGNLRAGPDASG
jgi:hypothetical protein